MKQADARRWKYLKKAFRCEYDLYVNVPQELQGIEFTEWQVDNFRVQSIKQDRKTKKVIVTLNIPKDMYDELDD